MYAIINLDDENKGIDFSEADWHFIIPITENYVLIVCFAFIVEGIKLISFTIVF